ncbi:MAG: type II toxin-antitoxin system HicA family toxin [Dehalococcoidia bacterium]|nr:type II toxin-antitoxin system HicA family toxin [Dehalococcoidia bacterium]MYK25669.1 type II toxin-antitoxin system HicA family toxin [Dehalococcoidia bacterium]
MTMARRERRIERLRRSQTDVSPEQLRAALESVGFELVNIVGSHWHYRHPARPGLVSVPFRRPIKRTYVREALEAIDEVMNDGDG